MTFLQNFHAIKAAMYMNKAGKLLYHFIIVVLRLHSPEQIGIYGGASASHG